MLSSLGSPPSGDFLLAGEKEIQMLLLRLQPGRENIILLEEVLVLLVLRCWDDRWRWCSFANC